MIAMESMIRVHFVFLAWLFFGYSVPFPRGWMNDGKGQSVAQRYGES